MGDGGRALAARWPADLEARVRIRHVPSALAAALAATALAGCSSGHQAGGADKAGGSNAPVVLRLAANTSPDQRNAADLRYFAGEVEKLSRGRLRVRVVFEAAGRDAVFAEPRIARMVRDGKFDLGWIPARAWDELGVNSLRALQTPFLITSYGLLDRVLTTPIAGQMLHGIRREGLFGLALVPDLLQHPFAADRPLLTPADYMGARIRVHPARTTDALLRAIGARPVHVADAETLSAFGVGKIDGMATEFPEAASTPFIVTGNVTFYPKVDTLFANPHALERLQDNQRAALRVAAQRTLEHLADTRLSESELLRDFCKTGGRGVTATTRELAQLERETRSLVAKLERDPETGTFIEKILTLKASTPPIPAVVVPSSCRPRHTAAPRERRRSPSMLNGTYRYMLTKAAANAFGPPITGHNVYPVVVTTTLRDGRWSLHTDELDTGTYTIFGDRVAFKWPRLGYTNMFTFTRDSRGTLRLKPVLPMDRGDQFVWAAAPWRRIGPPIAKIP